MKPRRRLSMRLALGLSLLALAPLASAADDYPQKPIRIVVPFAAGGPADILARLLGESLGRQFKVPVLVDNRPGAGGNLGTATVAKAAPDGYTLLLGYIGPLAINPYLFKKIPFDPVKDFAPVALLANSPLILVVNAGVPATSVAQLVDYAKTRQPPLAYGSGGLGSANHLAGEWFKTAMGIDLIHVPYQGVAPATTDLLGGQVAMVFNGISLSLPYIKTGRLRALAVTTRTRVPSLPDVPTMAESGIPGYDVSAWFGLLAPAGTQAAVLQRLESASAQAMAAPEVTGKLEALGLEPQAMPGPEFGRFIQAQLKVWSKVVRDSGATAE